MIKTGAVLLNATNAASRRYIHSRH